MNKKNISNKKLIISVIGTTSSGKTFLLFNLTKLFTNFALTHTKIPYSLKPEVKAPTVFSPNLPILNTLNELKAGLFKPTSHAPIPQVYEYQYDCVLGKIKPSFWEMYFPFHPKYKKYDIHFKVRNIPGEMLDIYFKERIRQNTTSTTLHDMFDNFINSYSPLAKIITDYQDANNNSTDIDLTQSLRDFVNANANRFYIERINTLINGFKKGSPILRGDLNELLDLANNEINGPKILLLFKNSEINDERECSDFRQAFYDYAAQSHELGTTAQDINDQIIKNFYSYLFFRISSDVIFCHDISAADQDSQLQILNNLSQTSLAMQNKHLYYAFTKYDKCIVNPEQNYISTNIKSLKEYWELTTKNLISVFTSKNYIRQNILHSIERIFATQPVPKYPDSIDNYPYLKYTYFVCSNYFNFTPPSFRSLEQSTETTNWSPPNYVRESFPLGCIELLMSLLDRNGYCKADELELDFVPNRYDLLSKVYLEEK